MRYMVQYAGHMPKGHRFVVDRLKVELGFNNNLIETIDSGFRLRCFPTRKAATAAWNELTNNANHPIYRLDDVAQVDDHDVSEWLYEQGRLVGIENHEAWFETLSPEDKFRHRIEYLEATLKASTLDMDALELVVKMASSHIEDIESGLEDGTYEKGDNLDLGQKNAALKKLRNYLAANRPA